MAADLKALLASDATVLGTWTQIAAPEMVDLIGLNGFQFTVIDCEHGFFGMETAENLSRACDAVGIASAVRVPVNDPTVIMKALDAGIRHVVVPNLSSGEQAERAVAATRFGPHGLRGACPCCRSGGHFIRNWQAYVADEEARVGAIALVESEEGYRNFRDIAAVKDLTAIMLGPFDLSVSMGLNGNWRDDRVLGAVREMVDVAVDAGHRVIMPVFSPDKDECRQLIDDWTARGVHSFAIGSDKIMVAHSFAEWTHALG
ncbi:MAG: aldolase/citrate lyase family protein [Alphaproteobacteria bacterium]|nr:aldolase/citrate lyase family protein [Alphaproteobacteria bacterium]